MIFRNSRKLKNKILSINFAILTFFNFLSNFLKHLRVGRHENIFTCFLEGNNNCRVDTKKDRIGRVSGNTCIEVKE